MVELSLPNEAFTSDKACAEFIIEINERLSKLNDISKKLKEVKAEAEEILLTRLEATGQKHFAFEDLGTFSKSSRTFVAFPTQENGGKDAAAAWLKLCYDKGIISEFVELLDVQQSRINAEPVSVIEEKVAEYNEQQRLNGSNDLIPESPFNKYEKQSLSSPRKRK